jgi:hypothetical protein
MVHEAVNVDRDRQLHRSMMRYEWWDADGSLRESRVRKHQWRWWYPDEITGALADAGYVGARVDGGGEAFIAVAKAP